MATFADMWNKAAKAGKKQFNNDDLPDGLYVTEVVSCKMGMTKDQTKDMVSWDLKVVEGEQKNNHIWVHRPFSKTDDSEQNEKAIQRALNDFIDLGLNAEAAVLKSTMIDIVGKHIEIKLVAGTNGQFKNFKRIVEPIPATPIGNQGASSFGNDVFPEEEIPF